MNPRVRGGYALLTIFAVAATIHFAHGEFNVGHPVTYAMAVIVCLPYQSAVPDER